MAVEIGAATVRPVSLFYSYSHRDEKYRRTLQMHLSVLRRAGLIAEWHDREICAGSDWQGEIDRNLAEADIVLLLVSPDFLDSDYCWGEEMTKALERHERGEARVIPVILRPCRWRNTRLARLQAVPKDGRPVTDWPNRDVAFDHVAAAIERIIEDQLEERRRAVEAQRRAEEEERRRREQEAVKAQQRAEEEERQRREREAAEARQRVLEEERQRREQETAAANLRKAEEERQRREQEAAQAKRRAAEEERQRREQEAEEQRPHAEVEVRHREQERQRAFLRRWLMGGTVVFLVSGVVGVVRVCEFQVAPRVVDEEKPRPWPGDTFADCEKCPEMVVVLGGTFLMGSPESEQDRENDEGPQRQVTIKPFAIGKYEVTFEEWGSCVAAGGCNDYRPSDYGWGRDSRPVINVSWRDAQAYVDWLAKKTNSAYRLPTEAEWEYAARATTTTPFSFGETITTQQANYNGNNTYGGGSKGEYRQQTVFVGTLPANSWGLHEIHGNVWEWVEDCYHNSYQGAPPDGTAWIHENCLSRVLRGGSWINDRGQLRSSSRYRGEPEVRAAADLGFRVAQTLK